MPASDDFQDLSQRARVEVALGPGGVRDQRLEVDGPLQTRARMISSGGFGFLRGENRAARDLVLRGEHDGPLLVLHVALRGPAAVTIDGLGAPLAGAGELELFVVPTARTTVRLPAGAHNHAFRITIAPATIAALAARHPPLEALAARALAAAPFRTGARPLATLGRLLDEIDDVMDSAHHDALRPLFLEGRALGWLAAALSATAPPASAPALSSGFPAGAHLSRREIDRMHEARDRLLARLADPPTLAELAAAIGSNEFALKRHFKAVFGAPVHGFLLARRLEHGRQLLRDTELPLKQIAGAVGYVHASHFSSAFRRAYGVPPGRYRDAHRGAGRSRSK